MRTPLVIAVLAAIVATIAGGPTAHAAAETRAKDVDFGTSVLQRGTIGTVDIGFEQLGGHPGTVEGKVTISVPSGTRVPLTGTDAAGQYRNPGWPSWLRSKAVRLSDATVNANRTQVTYSLIADAKFDTNVELRFSIPLEVTRTAPLTGRLSYLAVGTRAGGVGAWSVGGSTATRIAAGIDGTSGPRTTLARGGTTSAPILATTSTRASAVDGVIEAHAPAGTRFSDGQSSVTGWYEQDGVRHEDGMTLTDGRRAADGSTYQWRWQTPPAWSIPAGARFGWAVAVGTPIDAPAGEGVLLASLNGEALEGPFDGRSTTATTIPVNDRVLTGVKGPETTLTSGASAMVEARFETAVDLSAPRRGSSVRFRAPAGTTMDDEAPVRGAYQLPGSATAIAFTADQLVDGHRTEGGAVLTYRWEATGWRLPAGSVIRFAVPVTTPSDARAGETTFTADAAGTTPEGTFATSAMTPVTISTGPTLAPASLRNEQLVSGWDNVLRGSGHPGATLRVVDRFGNALASSAVGTDGTWSTVLPVAVNAKELTLHLAQTLGGVTETSDPLTVPAIVPPAVSTSTTTMVPGLLNRFGGAGPSGATFRVVNRWGTDLVPGTSTVDTSGRWRFDRVVSNGAASFSFRLQLAAGGWEARTPLFTATPSTFADARVLTTSVVPGVENDFAGTGTPNVEYRVVNDWGTELVPGPRRIGADGRWEFRRVVDRRAHDFRFRIEQHRGTLTVRSDLFILPIAAR